MIAILYNIRSVHNVGSIFRTADAAGIKKLYLCGITPTPLDRFGQKRKDFIKASLGAEDSVPWEKVGRTIHDAQESTLALIQQLKKDGYEIVAVEQDANSIPYTSYQSPQKPVVFMVGNEVDGTPKEILAVSDTILDIPMYGTKESLNVSVAFGIAAFEIKKVLQHKP